MPLQQSRHNHLFQSAHKSTSSTTIERKSLQAANTYIGLLYKRHLKYFLRAKSTILQLQARNVCYINIL